jgi:hypothetical protein
MNPAPKPPELKPCSDCPLWPSGTQSGFPTLEKMQACIGHVLGPEPHGMAAAEFLTELEAQRQARMLASIKPAESFVPGPFDRTYRLNPLHTYTPKRPMLIIPEDLL